MELPDEAVLGPAMLALSLPRRRFVTAWVNGAKNHSAAAALAGIGGTPNAQHVAAHRISNDPAVIAALREEADRLLRGGALFATVRLYELAQSPNEAVALKATLALAERAGLVVETSHRIIVENDTRSTDEIKQAVFEQFKKLYPGQALPIAFQPPVDVEFSEVDKELEDLCK